MADVTRDVATVTAYIQANNLLNGSFFNTVDQAYELARKFVKKWEKSLKAWDPNLTGMEFDEAIEDFVLNMTAVSTYRLTLMTKDGGEIIDTCEIRFAKENSRALNLKATKEFLNARGYAGHPFKLKKL